VAYLLSYLEDGNSRIHRDVDKFVANYRVSFTSTVPTIPELLCVLLEQFLHNNLIKTHGVKNNVKLVDFQQATIVNLHKNTKDKLLGTNAAIWYVQRGMYS